MMCANLWFYFFAAASLTSAQWIDYPALEPRVENGVSHLTTRTLGKVYEPPPVANRGTDRPRGSSRQTTPPSSSSSDGSISRENSGAVSQPSSPRQPPSAEKQSRKGSKGRSPQIDQPGTSRRTGVDSPEGHSPSKVKHHSKRRDSSSGHSTDRSTTARGAKESKQKGKAGISSKEEAARAEASTSRAKEAKSEIQPAPPPPLPPPSSPPRPRFSEELRQARRKIMGEKSPKQLYKSPSASRLTTARRLSVEGRRKQAEDSVVSDEEGSSKKAPPGRKSRSKQPAPYMSGARHEVGVGGGAQPRKPIKPIKTVKFPELQGQDRDIKLGRLATEHGLSQIRGPGMWTSSGSDTDRGSQGRRRGQMRVFRTGEGGIYSPDLASSSGSRAQSLPAPSLPSFAASESPRSPTDAKIGPSAFGSSQVLRDLGAISREPNENIMTRKKEPIKAGCFGCECFGLC